MKTYSIYSQGYFYCPTFCTIQEARQCLKEIVADSLKSARRSWKKAHKEKINADTYEIRAGKDPHCPRWGYYSIQTTH